MDVIEAINTRYSVRAYKPDLIEDEKLMAILDAGRMAPTANNRQPFKFIVIHTKGREEELQTIYSRPWFVQAPIVLCVCGQQELAWVRKDGKPYLYVDVAIAMDHMVLAAWALGIGTCFIAAFDEQVARTVLRLPESIEPVLFTPLGYPAGEPKAKERKDLDELVRYERW